MDEKERERKRERERERERDYMQKRNSGEKWFTTCVIKRASTMHSVNIESPNNPIGPIYSKIRSLLASQHLIFLSIRHKRCFRHYTHTLVQLVSAISYQWAISSYWICNEKKKWKNWHIQLVCRGVNRHVVPTGTYSYYLFLITHTLCHSFKVILGGALLCNFLTLLLYSNMQMWLKDF